MFSYNLGLGLNGRMLYCAHFPLYSRVFETNKTNKNVIFNIIKKTFKISEISTAPTQ